MKTYIKFLIKIFLTSFINIFFIMLSLVIIINLISELDFFKENTVNLLFPIYLSFLNSPTSLFEMLPFLTLISTQLFFIKLENNNEIQIFKYSGLKNSHILKILSITSILMGLFSVIVFYNFSSKLKNFYIELKSPFTTDNKYLAIITKNGLWIKDVVDNSQIIVNSSEIKNNFLINNFISEFNENYEIKKNIYSKEINIKDKNWIVTDAQITEKNSTKNYEEIIFKTNFDYERIQSLFSNLDSMSFLGLLELKKNYQSIRYSTTDIDIQIHKIISLPFYLMLITILSSIIMINTKNFKSTFLKITTGLFCSVIIYYINNFFYVLGNTEKIPYILSVWFPILILLIVNYLFGRKINEK